MLSIVCSTNTYTTPCSSICYHIFQINLFNSDHSILTGKKLFRKKKQSLYRQNLSFNDKKKWKWKKNPNKCWTLENKPSNIKWYLIEIVKIYEEYPSKEMKFTQGRSSTSVKFLLKFLFITFLYMKKSSTYFIFLQAKKIISKKTPNKVFIQMIPIHKKRLEKLNPITK